MKVRDPVCGMILEDVDAKVQSTFQGTTYYFCSDTCKQTFDEHPEAYAETSGVSAEFPEAS